MVVAVAVEAKAAHRREAAVMGAVAAMVAVGLLPRPSTSSHLSSEFSAIYSQMKARVCGGVPSPLIEPKMGRDRKGPT